jgi:hypothetical protein
MRQVWESATLIAGHLLEKHENVMQCSGASMYQYKEVVFVACFGILVLDQD